MHEAAGHFRFLTMADIRSYRHWMGLGAALQMSKEYQKAIEAYEVAASLGSRRSQIAYSSCRLLIWFRQRQRCLFALSFGRRGL